MNEKGLLSIGDICMETGLTVDVVRAWERRYGFPVPVRLPSGHRRYSEVDLARLRLMAQAVAHGHRAARVVRSEDASLRRLIMPHEDPRIEQLFSSVVAMDGDAITLRLRSYLMESGWEALLRQVVAPLLDRVGVAWADGTIEIHHEHLLSEIMEDFLRALRQEYHPIPGRGRVLLCTLPTERHRLGLLMAALAYAAHGARTNLLGVDLPIASIAQTARSLQVDRVAVSLSIQSTGESVRRMIIDLRDRLPGEIRLLVGGKGAARTRQVKGVERVDELNVA